MISQMKWVYYGGGIAVVGILLVIIALRSVRVAHCADAESDVR